MKQVRVIKHDDGNIVLNQMNNFSAVVIHEGSSQHKDKMFSCMSSKFRLFFLKRILIQHEL